MRVTGNSARAHRSASLGYVLRPWVPVHPTKALLFLALFLPITLSPSGALAVEWYVDAAAAPGGDGASWEKAFNGIQEAADAAADGDTIIVAPGTYREGSRLLLNWVTVQSVDPNDPNIVAATVIADSGIDAIHILEGFTVRGGWVWAGSWTVRICKNTIRDGAGVGCFVSSALISSNVILNNSNMYSGGIYCDQSSVTISNNVLRGNSATRDGGAIYCDRSSPTILNNTIVGNRAKEDPGTWGVGGIYCDEESSPTIRNCIIWDNGDDLFNCHATYSCIEDGDPGEGNLNYYPYFVDLANGDYHLSSWSPCIDAGDPMSPFSLEPEPNGGRVDMGAYGNTPEATSRSADTGGDGLPDDWEVLHFGHLDFSAEDDPDADGIRNMTEYLFGWNPMSPSTTRVENVTAGRSYAEIQPAISEAAEGDELVVSPGTYPENIDFLGKALTIRSMDPFDPSSVSSTVVEGDTSGAIATFMAGESRSSVLWGLHLGPAVKRRSGRGIFCKGASPTISHNIIRGNAASGGWLCATKDGPGGGIFVCGGCPLIEHNTIEDNESIHGSAIYCEAGGPVITGNVIRTNKGQASTVHLQNCPLAVIEANSVIYNYDDGCAGLEVWSSSVRARNNLVAFNDGAGFYFVNATGVVRNCTILGNRGVGIERYKSASGVPLISNCVLWYNDDDLVNQTAVYSCIQDDDPGEGNIHADPQFGDPAKGDFRLSPNSPCINAGNTAHALSVAASPVSGGVMVSWSAGTDLDENPRISGNAVDVGAYEFQEGPASLSFIVEYSSDLRFWESIDVGPAWQWLDEKPDGLGRRFYRIGIR
jgi:hypothetical protein